MTIHIVDHVKELPSTKLRGYSLGKDYSEQHAAEDYKAVYGVQPVEGWRWGSYLYFKLPEGK